MGLRQQLDDMKAARLRAAPAGTAELYNAHIEKLRAIFVSENALDVGDEVPEFELPNHRGKAISMRNLLSDGPVVLTFYRGGWCPYCNLQLRAYQAILEDIKALGAQLVAVSPELPDRSMSTVETNQLTFHVLTDVGNVIARKLGLIWALPEDLQLALRLNGLDLEVVNGDKSWELPITATYVIAQDGHVALASIDLEYRNRLEPEAILSGLKSLSRT